MATPPSNNETDELIKIISHDLSAPMRHIREFGKLLLHSLSHKISDDEREYFKYMNQGLEQADDMINALIEYSHLKTRPLKLEQIDSDELIRLSMKNIDQPISLNDIPKTIYGDKKRLGKLFSYLIQNAIKFTPNDTEPKVEINFDESDGYQVFYIQDNGIGIVDNQKENAFKLFKRLSNDNPNDLGIGLTFSKVIVEHHGGEIKINDTPNGGCVIQFTLPLPQ